MMVLKFAQCDCLQSAKRPLFIVRAVVENFWRATQSSPRCRPSRVCSGAELLLLLAAASTTAALLLLPAVTLHRLHRAVTKLDDALPHGLQHRCESRSSTPAPHLSNRPSRSASRRRLPLRGAPCTQLLPARQSQRQPVGVHAAGPDHQLRANFPGARAARSASPPRSGARRKIWAWWGTGRTRFATEVDTKVFYGENLFCRQSRETCESGLRSRRSRSVLIVLISLSEGLPRERTSPSARRGGRPPVPPNGPWPCTSRAHWPHSNLVFISMHDR